MSAQASSIFCAIFQLTQETLFDAPAPIIAVVFVFVVLSGIPHAVAEIILANAASSAAKP